MANKAQPKLKQRGRPSFMKDSAVTTINIEKTLLERVRRTAYGLKQSVSQWVSQAALEKLARETK